MYIVAIDDLGDDRAGIARALSKALGTIFYDALIRVSVPGKGPLIVAVYAEKNIALEKTEKLRVAGFRTLVLGQDEVETDGESTIMVRRFLFGDAGLEIEARTGDAVRIGYNLIDTIIRGTRIVQTTETETMKEQKFAAGRAIITSGLMTTKSVTVTQQSRTDVREGFMSSFIPANCVVSFFLNPNCFTIPLAPALRPTRVANFAFVLDELKAETPRRRV